MRNYRHIIFRMFLLICLSAPSLAHATGLQAESTDVDVRIESIRYDIVVRGRHVDATMEVRFWAASGDDNAASLRFPLPEGAVLHHAEIYLPDQDRWEAAETQGRREGQSAFEEGEFAAQRRLLVQQIGLGLYRARVFPIDSDSRLMLRMRYAHVLEGDGSDEILRIAHASPDATASEPLNGLTIRVDAGNEFEAGSFGADGGTFTPSDGIGNLSAVGKLDHDIELRLARNPRQPSFNGLQYVPALSTLPVHTHLDWLLDLSGYPSLAGTPRNVVFIVDRSGSMEGKKMVETKRAVIQALENMGPHDRFGLVAFDSTLEVFRETMAGTESVTDAAAWVDALQTQAQTAMAAALERAAQLALTEGSATQDIELLLITDGRPTVGPSKPEAIVDRMRGQLPEGRSARIFGCGIGYDLDQTVLNGISELTDGESTFALDDAAITGQILDLFSRVRGGGIREGVLTVKGEVVVDLLLPPRVFAGDALQAGSTMATPTSLLLRGFTSDGGEVFVSKGIDIRGAANDTFDRIAAPLAANLWVDKIAREIDQGSETGELVDEAVVLAKTYGIVTRYASFVAFDSPMAYVERGVERVARDEAGIAIASVSPSSTSEARIGGEGAGSEDASGNGVEADDVPHPADPMSSCACDLPGGSPRSPSGPSAMWLLGGVLLLRRSRARTVNA